MRCCLFVFTGAINDSLLPSKRNSSKSLSQKSTAAYFEACRVQFEKYLKVNQHD